MCWGVGRGAEVTRVDFQARRKLQSPFPAASAEGGWVSGSVDGDIARPGRYLFVAAAGPILPADHILQRYPRLLQRRYQRDGLPCGEPGDHETAGEEQHG